jgi:ATP-dependent Lhr-like helicase
VSAVGATQFALPAALELMRSLRQTPDQPEIVMLAATDPANPYGTMLKWPAGREGEAPGRGATRTVGAQVIFVNGHIAAYLSRGGRQVLVYLPEDEPQRSVIGRALASQLAVVARTSGLIVDEVNGMPASKHPIAEFLQEAGFSHSAMGYMMRRSPLVAPIVKVQADA